MRLGLGASASALLLVLVLVLGASASLVLGSLAAAGARGSTFYLRRATGLSHRHARHKATTKGGGWLVI